MGIRIKRALGYGLDDVVEDDPRLNYDSPVFQWESSELTLEKYREFLATKSDTKPMEWHFLSDKWLDEKPRKPDPLWGSFHWGTGDGGLENVLCLTPVWLQDEWFRFDNSMDWILDSYVLEKNGDSWVKVLPHGIYPFSGTYMDTRAGERLKNDVMPWVRIWTNLDYESKVKIMEADHSALDEMAESFGMTHLEASQFVAPHVPEEIHHLAEFGKVFNDPATALQLRPMIYTFWS